MLKRIIDKIYDGYNLKTFKKEDNVVLEFIDSISVTNSNLNYLEVGSGLCRFALIVRDRFSNITIKGIEISQDLVNLGVEKGLDVVQGNVVKMDFSDQAFDLIHCSHVIEHLSYEAITNSLDELLRILKPNGYLIIRSPLQYPGFYFDLDHIRPYPPEAILNFFRNDQQQRVGSFRISEVLRWYRREAVTFFNSSHFLIKALNIFFKIVWLGWSFPRSKPNGYVFILKKI